METDRQKKIREMQDELDSLKAEEEKLDKLGYKYKLATFIHENFCRLNHTDGCDWFYDGGDWKSSSRQKYLEKAKQLIEMGLSKEQMEKVVTILHD